MRKGDRTDGQGAKVIGNFTTESTGREGGGGGGANKATIDVVCGSFIMRAFGLRCV